MMNTTSSRSSAESLGRWLGRGWRGYVRRERSVVVWMVSRGTPGAIAAALPWVVRLTALGLLLYFTFWLALLLVFLVLVARGYDAEDSTMPEEPEEECGMAMSVLGSIPKMSIEWTSTTPMIPVTCKTTKRSN